MASLIGTAAVKRTSTSRALSGNGADIGAVLIDCGIAIGRKFSMGRIFDFRAPKVSRQTKFYSVSAKNLAIAPVEQRETIDGINFFAGA